MLILTASPEEMPLTNHLNEVNTTHHITNISLVGRMGAEEEEKNLNASLKKNPHLAINQSAYSLVNRHLLIFFQMSGNLMHDNTNYLIHAAELISRLVKSRCMT